MKKIIAAILLTFTMPILADSTVALPTTPIIPTMATVSPNAASALTDTTTNSVFINQVGDNPNVNITQDGNSNKQGSALRPIYLRGIDQTIVTRQVGNNNDLNLEAVNPNTGSGVGAKITIQQLGNNNSVDAQCGYGSSSTGVALTGCKAADLNWKLNGNSNQLQFRGTGDSLKSAIDVLGNTNKFYIDAIGDKHTQTIQVTGDNNNFNLTQTSVGNTGSSIWVSLTGTSNNITISQSGSINQVANLISSTNSGTYNINQK
jgi:hypothetical protein